MKYFQFLFASALVLLQFGCGTESSPTTINVPAPTVVGGQEQTGPLGGLGGSHSISVSDSGGFTGGTGTTTLSIINSFTSFAPAEKAPSALIGKSYSAQIEKISFFEDDVSGTAVLVFGITETELTVSLHCLFSGGAMLDGEPAATKLNIEVDGNIIYLRDSFSVTTSDGVGHSCSFSLDSKSLWFSDSGTRPKVRMGGLSYDFKQVL